MSDILFDNTKLASYFLWEYTKGENALSLWVCAEDIAHYLETTGIFSSGQIDYIKNKGIYSYEYIGFVRHIAYRIYIYTNNCDAEYNWFSAEKLLCNGEWCAAVTQIAKIFYENQSNFDLLQGVRSDVVRKSHSNT